MVASRVVFLSVLLGLGLCAPITMSMQKHHTLQRGSRYLDAEAAVLPAWGDVWPVAIYWVDIQVGTPPITVPVAVDSGSGDLDIGAKGCVGCPTTPPNNPYDHTKSSTAKPVFPYVFSNTYETCDLSNPVAPCTISGNLYSDQVSAGGLGPVNVSLGAITKQTTNFDQFNVVCGVMGFIDSGKSTVFEQLVKAGKSKNLWAICMNEGSKSNGTVTLSEIDNRLYTGSIQYTPMVDDGFYSVKMDSIKVGEASISGLNPTAILDTGTNVLLLPTKAYDSMKAAFLDMCASKKLAGICDQPKNETLFEGHCFPLTAAEVAEYPDITLNVGDASNPVALTMVPTDYLLFNDFRSKASNQICLGVRPTGQSFLIIGDTTMQSHYLIFDNANRRIGWAPVNKANCGSL
eukprot:NODE_1434_length_1334_cov_70.681856_g1421_i0.p1 GENE.NODE_1434_length_1334_cov_70.681856_g1421_i0~~NODE_1434_length_1334_cov_70.681856_g1421_i0.p1  ORF type:complete len:403 (+),score=89.22 NODE_1434_length_1334_cov_70.681856_g1421_i0:60-1268(+)